MRAKRKFEALIVGRDINVIICFCKIFVIFVQILLKPKQIEYSQSVSLFVCKDYSLISHRVCQFVSVIILKYLLVFIYLIFLLTTRRKCFKTPEHHGTMAGVNHVYSHHVFKLLENDCVPRQN